MEVGNLADLRIVGGHPALDLANTVAPRPPATARQEFLPDPPALLRWAHRLGLVDAAERDAIDRAWSAHPGAAQTALTDVLTLRTLLDQALAGQQLDALTRRWAAAINRSALLPTNTHGITAPQGLTVPHGITVKIGTDPPTMIADRLADATVDLLRTADLTRLRACPLDDGGCGWLFLDRSRNLSRKWCSMDDCGTTAKSRRLTARRRTHH